MGAVIANAIYDATGARLLQLPMTPVRVLEALKVLEAGTVLEALQGF
jgi:CO/xanthine dehydrogenase Mo-binding subunit